MPRGYRYGTLSAKEQREILEKEEDSDSDEVQDVLSAPVSENPTYFTVPQLKGLVNKRPRETKASLRISEKVCLLYFQTFYSVCNLSNALCY